VRISDRLFLEAEKFCGVLVPSGSPQWLLDCRLSGFSSSPCGKHFRETTEYSVLACLPKISSLLIYSKYCVPVVAVGDETAPLGVGV
jgi:hypothetical protein